MNKHHLFNDQAEVYAQARPDYPAAVFDYLEGVCNKRMVAWDCACGNGQAALSLVNSFEFVHATDISEEQIKNAKLHPRVEYSVSPSEHSGLQANSVDLICVAQALHWFDYDDFWPEVDRVLKPGGVFAALGYNFPKVDPIIDSIIQRELLDVIEPYWATENKLIWNSYRDITFPYGQLEVPQFDMKMTCSLGAFFSFLRTFSATRRCMDDQGDDFFHSAYDSAKEVWGASELVKHVSLDFVFKACIK